MVFVGKQDINNEIIKDMHKKAYPMGIPKLVVKDIYKAYFDELAVMAVPGTVILPVIETLRIGQLISVANISLGTVTVTPAKGLLGHFSTASVPNNTIRQFVALTKDLWAVVDASLPRWEDLRYPVTGINPPGQASDPTVNSTTGLLEFSASATNIIAGVAQMPHSWKNGTIIYPHLHLFAGGGTDPSTLGANVDTVWTFQYKWFNNLAGVTATYTSLSNVITMADYVGGLPCAQMENISGIGNPGIDGTDKHDSSVILWILSRVGGNAADNYAGIVTLMEFDIHYLNENLGTYTVAHGVD